MSDDTKPPEQPAEKPAAPKSAKKQDLVRLEHDVKGDWTLRIGNDEYPVQAGVVDVPAWHVGAARQAGFR